MVSFTGSLATGKRLMINSAETIKRVALELGGKNPNIIFADADLDAAIDNALTAVFLHSGQVCSSGARLLVEKKIHDQVVDEISRRADLIRLGGSHDDDAETGALISAAHRDKVERYVADAIAEGAVLRAGGKRPEGSQFANGFFYRPTVLDNCTTEMSCVQDESFGPILTVETFETEEEAIKLGNDSIYGLAAGVWTENIGRAVRMSKALRAGTVWVNTYRAVSSMMPFGGMKHSGIGRESGIESINQYLETKSTWISYAEGAPGNPFIMR
jgi:betaine-aldehyde dehydrogenase